MCRPGRKGRADLTSSPPSSRLAPAVRPESPTLLAGNWTQGLRSLWHLSRHLTARADDNHAAPRWRPLLAECFHTHSPNVRTVSIHRLLRGLPGYLILFDPHAFVPQRPLGFGMLPSQSEFCVISMHFTATQRIPHTSIPRQPLSFNGRPGLSPDI